MSLSTAIAVGAGRLTHWGLHGVLRRNASQLPGRVALALDRNLIADLSHKLGRGAIVVCGTNGKTTTNNVLAAAIESCHQRVLCNRAGANMAAGVASALLPGSSADWAVIEADELSTVHILPGLRPKYMVLLNLFRDQLDRAGEIDHVQDTIAAALASSPNTVLVANSDDPLCMGVALRARKSGTRVLTFGIGEDLGLPADRVPEARFCQACGAELEYEYRAYAQMGKFSCPKCDFCRPQLDFCATGVRVTREGVEFDVVHDGKRSHISAGFGGVYMVYNLLAAFAAASLAGVGAGSFQGAIDDYNPRNGRLQHFVVDGREVILNLAKNPTGFNQNLSLLLADERPKALYFAINDNFNDGKDISWIWDVDFERLAGQAELTAICGGTRAGDVQVRMKYAGIEADVAPLVEGALAQAASLPKDRPLYVLTNYSALWPAKATLERVGVSND